MTRILTYHIEKNITVGNFLKEQGYSHGVIVHLKKTPRSILRREEWLYVRDMLYVGDVLTVTLEEDSSSPKILPVPLPFDIVYEDEDILVVNKPADMPIHPSLNHYENTLANGIAYYFQ